MGTSPAVTGRCDELCRVFDTGTRSSTYTADVNRTNRTTMRCRSHALADGWDQRSHKTGGPVSPEGGR